MKLVIIFLSFIAFGAVGYAVWEFSKRNKFAGLVGSCFWFALIGGLLKLYKFDFLNFISYWGMFSLAMAAAYAYSNVAYNYREKEIAQCKSSIESLKGKDNLTTEEETRLHKLEKFVAKNTELLKG